MNLPHNAPDYCTEAQQIKAAGTSLSREHFGLGCAILNRFSLRSRDAAVLLNRLGHHAVCMDQHHTRILTPDGANTDSDQIHHRAMCDGVRG